MGGEGDTSTGSESALLYHPKENHGRRRLSAVAAVIDPSQFAAPRTRRTLTSKSPHVSPHRKKKGGALLLSASTSSSVRRQHPVEQLAHRLGLLTTITREGGSHGASSSVSSSSPGPLVTQALDAYRLLETRIKVGCLGKGDSCEARAACLLWRQQHQQPPMINSSSAPSATRDALSWDHLAARVGTKSTTLQALHSRITNYLVETPSATTRPRQPALQGRHGGDANHSTATTGRFKSTTDRISTSVARSAAERTTTTSTRAGRHDPRGIEAADRTLWAALSIRLQCPALQVRQAQSLWSALESHVAKLPNAHDRRGYQYDMSRYRPAYQAACLHHVMTSRGRRHCRNEAKATAHTTHGTAQRNRGSKTGGLRDDDGDAEGDNSRLGTGLGGSLGGSNPNDGHLTRAAGREGSTHKMADFVLPNSFTYLEMRQVSKQVAQFVDEIGQVPTSDSASSWTTNEGMRHPSNSLGGRTNSMGAPSADPANPSRSRGSVSRFDAPTSTTKRRRVDDAASDVGSRRRSRFNDDENIDDASENSIGGSPGMEDHDDASNEGCDSSTCTSSIVQSKSIMWVDRWLEKLWNDALAVDRNDTGEVESLADDVLRRFGLLAEEVGAGRESCDPAAGVGGADRADSDVATALLTQDFEGDGASTCS